MSYETTINTLLGGFKIKPSERFHLTVDLAWNDAEAAMGSFRFPAGEAFGVPRPNQSYDFAETHLYSDLSSTFIEAGLQARYEVKSSLYLTGGYRHLDFEDDAPYLLNGTGSADFYNFGIGWTFGSM